MGIFTSRSVFENVEGVAGLLIATHLSEQFVEQNPVHVIFDFPEPLQSLSGTYRLSNPAEMLFEPLKDVAVQFFNDTPVFELQQMHVNVFGENENEIEAFVFECGRRRFSLSWDDDYPLIEFESGGLLNLDIAGPAARRIFWGADVRRISSRSPKLDGYYWYNSTAAQKEEHYYEKLEDDSIRLFCTQEGEKLREMRVGSLSRDKIHVQFGLNDQERRRLEEGLSVHWNTTTADVPREVAKYVARTTTKGRRRRKTKIPVLRLR